MKIKMLLLILVIVLFYIIVNISSFKNNKLLLPHIGIGTAGLFGKTKEIICHHLKLNFTLIDTAQAIEWYNENDIYDVIHNNHCYNYSNQLNDIFIITKIHPRSFNEIELKKVLIKSEKNLNKNKFNNNYKKELDMVLIHSPYCYQNNWQCTKEQEKYTWQNVYQLLQDYKYNKDNNFHIKINSIGVSNFDINLLNELMRDGYRKYNKNKFIANQNNINNENINEIEIEYIPDAVQNWMDPFHQDIEVRKFCKKYNIIYIAYSSFGTQWNYKYNINPIYTSNTLNYLANKYNTNVNQIILIWLYQLNIISIPKSIKYEHILMNSELLKKNNNPNALFTLNDEDMQMIKELDGTLGNPWD